MSLDGAKGDFFSNTHNKASALLDSKPLSSDSLLSELVTKTVAQVGENVIVRRAQKIGVDVGVVSRLIYSN